MPAAVTANVGIVIIGRNEGARLARCLASTRGMTPRVYVDSGSADGSVLLSREAGAIVVELSSPPPYTAARARNAGLARLLADYPQLEFVQTLDGDCELDPQWIVNAIGELHGEPRLALVFGRLREREPQRSLYNALCDQEWQRPVGEASGVGGNALFRVEALREVGCYSAAMIAGEEMDLALRLRARGWKLRSIATDMALHDADMTRFAQWWRRARRSGHACAELALLHPSARDPDWTAARRRIVLWGGAMPLALLLATAGALLLDPRWWLLAALLLLPWPVNVLRLARREQRRGRGPRLGWALAGFWMLAKLPEMLGVLDLVRNRLLRRDSQLIEWRVGK